MNEIPPHEVAKQWLDEAHKHLGDGKGRATAFGAECIEIAKAYALISIAENLNKIVKDKSFIRIYQGA